METGESTPLNEGDRIVRGKSVEAYREKKKKEEQAKKEQLEDLLARGTYVQVIHTEERKIEKDLSLPLSNVLLRLFHCVTLESKNYLIHTSGENKGKKMNQKEIASFLGKSERQTVRDLNALVELEALKSEKNPKGKNERFYSLNSVFFTATSREGVKLGFTKVFHDKLKEIESKLSSNQYGALLKFMRFFHHQTYYLVRNPDYNIIINPNLSISSNLLLEENESVLQHLNQRKLADIIGIDEKVVIKYVEAYKNAGILMVLESNYSHRFMIHPDLMFRKSGKGDKNDQEYADFVRSQFKQLEPKTLSKSKRKRKRK